jgi:hypothetical protein
MICKTNFCENDDKPKNEILIEMMKIRKTILIKMMEMR